MQTEDPPITRQGLWQQLWDCLDKWTSVVLGTRFR